MILLLTHQLIGSSLLAQARLLLGQYPKTIMAFEVDPLDDVDHQFDKLVHSVKPASDDSLLILTDLYGATPSNLAHRLETSMDCHIIHGVNLPMLVRLWNYHAEPIDTIIDKLVSGAKESIFSGEKPV